MADREIIVKIVDQTATGLKSVSDNLNSVDKSAGGLIGTFGNLKTVVGGFVAAFAVKEIIDFGKQVVDATAKFQNYENQLKLVTGSNEELKSALSDLTSASQSNRASFEETISLYGKLRLATESLGASHADVITVANNFQKALVLSGADANTAAGAIRQFGQAMASGTVRGDEFNSIVEALGPALIIMARESGITVGELRKMSQAGQLTAEVFFEMVKNTQALGAAFANTNPTIEQMNQRLSDSYTHFLNNSTVGEAYSGFLFQLSRRLDQVSEREGALANMNLGEIWNKAKDGTISYAAALQELEQRYALHTEGLGWLVNGLNNGFDAQARYADQLKQVIDATKEQIEADKKRAEEIERVKQQTEALDKAIVANGSSYQGIKDRIAEYQKELEKSKTEEQKAADLKVQLEKDIRALEAALAQYGSSIPQDVQDKYNEALRVTRERLESVNAILVPVAATQADLARWTNDTSSAYYKFNESLQQSLELAGLEPEIREQQIAANRAVEAAMRDAAKEHKTLTAQQIADIRAYAIASTKEAQRKDKELKDRIEAQKEAEKLLKEFDTDTQKVIRDNYEATTTRVQQLEDEKQAYILRAKELGVENDKRTQDAILAYDESIKREQIKLEEDLQKKRQKAIDDTVTEYSSLYGFLGDKLSELTGVSSKEFGLIRDVTKLVFGTDINQIFKETFANGVAAVKGFGDGTRYETRDISSNIAGEMMASENSVGSFANNSLTVMSNWVKSIFNNFATLGGGIIDILGTAFEWLTGGFSSVFGSLSSFIGGFFGSIGDLISGINLTSFTDLFKADGGYIPAGGFAIAGEAGPEIVQGPAYVTSTADTADIFSGGVGGGGSMNVTFNISTVDASGFDELLASRRDVITDLVRTAVVESPSRQLRGVY